MLAPAKNHQNQQVGMIRRILKVEHTETIILKMNNLKIKKKLPQENSNTFFNGLVVFNG